MKMIKLGSPAGPSYCVWVRPDRVLIIEAMDPGLGHSSAWRVRPESILTVEAAHATHRVFVTDPPDVVARRVTGEVWPEVRIDQ